MIGLGPSRAANTEFEKRSAFVTNGKQLFKTTGNLKLTHLIRAQTWLKANVVLQL